METAASPQELLNETEIGNIHSTRIVKFFSDLSPQERKAEAQRRHEPNELMHQMRCLECRMPMWGFEDETENICEDCGYLLRDKMQEYQSQKYRQGATGDPNAFTRKAETQTPVGVTPSNKQTSNPFGQLEQTKNRPAQSPFADTAKPTVKNPFSR